MRCDKTPTDVSVQILYRINSPCVSIVYEEGKQVYLEQAVKHISPVVSPATEFTDYKHNKEQKSSNRHEYEGRQLLIMDSLQYTAVATEHISSLALCALVEHHSAVGAVGVASELSDIANRINLEYLFIVRRHDSDQNVFESDTRLYRIVTVKCKGYILVLGYV